MRPDTETALQAYYSARYDQKVAAKDALGTAFPPLEETSPITGCCDYRFAWNDTGQGGGFVCVDDDGRVGIDLEGLPQAVIGAAVDLIFGTSWFDDAPDGIAEAEPGEHSWDDEVTGSELVITVHDGGRADLYFRYATMPDTVTLLDELHTAYANTEAELQPTT
jgi:hypothetical protein